MTAPVKNYVSAWWYMTKKAMRATARGTAKGPLLSKWWRMTKVYAISIWRQHITHRCCQTCAEWNEWKSHPTVGKCRYKRRFEPSNFKCKNWHKKQHQEVPPCNMTVK